MEIVIEGHGVDITPALRDYISTKMLKIQRHAPLQGHPCMTISNGNPQVTPVAFQVALCAALPSDPIQCQETGTDIHATIDTVIDDVDRILCKHII